MRGSLFFNIYKTQVAFWVGIVCGGVFFFSTHLYAQPQKQQSPPPSAPPIEHTPQNQVSPSRKSSSIGTPTPPMPPLSTPAPHLESSGSTQFVDQTEDPPKEIDLSQFPATAVDDVVVPLPSEIFGVLDKMGSPNWKEYFPASFGKNTGERAQVALLLGAVIADGFIAVETEDPEKVKQVGREVLSLADAINVRKAVIARSKSIIEKADTKDWAAVRKELDGALQDVRTAMQELNDNDIAQLVSLGGWLQGTEVLTSIVKKDYNAPIAGLLHQPELVNFFLRRIDSMPKRLKQNQYVSSIKDVLKTIHPLVEKGQIPEADVEKINQLTHDIVHKFTSP